MAKRKIKKQKKQEFWSKLPQRILFFFVFSFLVCSAGMLLANFSGMKIVVKVPSKYITNQSGGYYDSGMAQNHQIITQLAGGGQATEEGIDLTTLVLIVASVIFILVGTIMYLGIRMGWF